MKLLKNIIIGIIGVVVVAGAFYACQKDQDILQKSNGLPADDELWELELYTPDENTVSDKLLMFTNYMNEPTAYPMPDMEIKEAIWYAEAFFNLGICDKQEYAAEFYDLRETYEIEISFVENGEGVFLDGEVLQSAYRDLLLSIKANICDEYAINFGDVYVSAISSEPNKAVLCLTTVHGKKTITPVPVLWTRTNKIVHSNFNQPLSYPGNGNDKTTVIPATASPGYPYDPFMEATLNQEHANVATSVIRHRRSAGLPYYSVWNMTIPVNPPTITLYAATYCGVYGWKYRDYIYANLCGDIPTCYAPLWAFCEVHTTIPIGPPAQNIAYHIFGLDYIYQECAPDIFNDPLLMATVEFMPVGG